MRPRFWLVLAAGIVCAAALVAVFLDVRSVVQETRESIERLLFQMEHSGMTLETTWDSSGPLHHKVTTPRKEGETDEQHAARHQSAVAALKALYPPV